MSKVSVEIYFQECREKHNNKTCKHKIPSWIAKEKVSDRQPNALRIEVFDLSDRCCLKVLSNSPYAKRIAPTDVANGYLLGFGACEAPCPSCIGVYGD
jgi:hypothetical protein